MEFTLHQQLKHQYAGRRGKVEVIVGDYRIDAVRGKELIEIQYGSLAAIRRKIDALLTDGHRVRVVKPLVAHKTIIRQEQPDGPVISRRRSPKRGQLVDVFEELVYVARLLPHRQLTVDVPLVRVEEWRLPPKKTRRWRRRRAKFRVHDVRLLEIEQILSLRAPTDLLELVDMSQLPSPFHTGDLAEAIGRSRWEAQRAAYCLRESGAAQVVGKQRNTLMYKAA